MRPWSFHLTAIALALPGVLHAQAQPDTTTAEKAAADKNTEATALEPVTVSGNWFGGSGLSTGVKTFPGARTQLQKSEIEATGALSIADVMRRIPGVQATENSGNAGSAISLNIGVRGLTGRYSPRSTVLLDGLPMAVAPYGQPQLSFAPVSLANIESIDVVRGGGAVRYGPQNVGGILNFKTRSIPGTPGLSGDVTVRYNAFTEGGGHNEQVSAFVGTQADNGLGLGLLYSGLRGSEWRKASGEKLDDVALKARYELTATSEIYGKVAYYDVQSRTPGGLTVAEYNANPWQNTRPTDFWNGTRKSVDVGYLNNLSSTQEFEVRAYFNDSVRSSTLINAARSAVTLQPRSYHVLGLEPRFTQRLALAGATHDVTVGYRFIQERGTDTNYTRNLTSGALSTPVNNDNATDAHSLYVDDRIAIGQWRITPGVRFEHIDTQRTDRTTPATFSTKNNKALPSLNVAYLVTPAWTVFANYNTSFGAVQNTQMNSQTAANPLKPELAKTAELGGRYRDGQWNAELTLFRLRFDNQIQQVAGSNPPVFQNIGETKHDGVEAALDYSFAKSGALAGLNLYATYAYTKALQDSGATAGRDVPFYSRHTDTVGARYQWADWTFNLGSTHQSSQYADNANTVAENATATLGRIPGYRVWNAQVGWKLPVRQPVDLQLGVNNLGDKRYYTRNVDGNPGRMAAAPRTVYVQARLGF